MDSKKQRCLLAPGPIGTSCRTGGGISSSQSVQHHGEGETCHFLVMPRQIKVFLCLIWIQNWPVVYCTVLFVIGESWDTSWDCCWGGWRKYRQGENWKHSPSIQDRRINWLWFLCKIWRPQNPRPFCRPGHVCWKGANVSKMKQQQRWLGWTCSKRTHTGCY